MREQAIMSAMRSIASKSRRRTGTEPKEKVDELRRGRTAQHLGAVLEVDLPTC